MRISDWSSDVCSSDLLASREITDPKRRGSQGKDLRPIVRIVDKKGEDLTIPGTDLPAQYLLPPRSIVNLQDGAPVGVGDVVTKVPQEASKTRDITRSEEHTSELQSLMRISYAVFCLKKKNK